MQSRSSTQKYFSQRKMKARWLHDASRIAVEHILIYRQNYILIKVLVYWIFSRIFCRSFWPTKQKIRKIRIKRLWIIILKLTRKKSVSRGFGILCSNWHGKLHQKMILDHLWTFKKSSSNWDKNFLIQSKICFSTLT